MIDLVEYMFRHFEDPEAMSEALTNLEPWLEENVETEEADEGYALEPLEPSDVRDVDYPNRTLANLLGAAGAAPSAFPVPAQARHILERDQVWANPLQYQTYERSYTGKQEFVDRTGVLRTTNDVLTSSFGVKIPYLLYKDYRWIEREDREPSIAARSWVAERSCNDGGGNCLELSFSVDLFVGHAKGTHRFTSTWSEATSAIPIGDDLLVAGLAGGIQNIFDNAEEWLEEN
jgi:hypothetical protein